MERMPNTLHGSLSVALLVLVGATACRTGMTEERVQPAGAAMSESNIAAVAATANTAEVQSSQLALSRSTNPSVREFAQHMVQEHSAANQRISRVASNLNIRPQGNAVTQQLSTNAEQTMEALRSMSGPAFDRAYMDHEVAMHRWTLRTLDDTLIPSARSAELHTVLTEMRAHVANHLQRAEQIERSLD